MKAILFHCIDNFGKAYKYVVVCTEEDVEAAIRRERSLSTEIIDEELLPARGYKDRVASEDEFYLDCNGKKIEIGMTVHWHDEAGKDEDGRDIDFVVVDYDIYNDGYFNLAFDGEEYPERWAWHNEIEII